MEMGKRQENRIPIGLASPTHANLSRMARFMRSKAFKLAFPLN